jgi:hypothetical protein
MALTPQEYEKNFLDNIVSLTGHSLKDWMDVAKSSGLEKPMELTKFFKEQHQLNHSHASMLSAIYRNGGKPAYANSEDLLDKQLKGKEDLRPLYEATAAFIQKSVPGCQVIAKVTYVSFAGKKEFAAVQFKKGEVRLGIALGNRAFDTTFEKAKISGPMAHISHMVVLTDAGQLDSALMNELKNADLLRNG